MELAKINPHSRDEDVRLHPDYEKNHIYVIKGKNHTEINYKSVTTFIADYFDKFDPHQILDMWEKNKDPRLSQKTRKEWLQEWEQLGEAAREAGTYMHKQFEAFFNGFTPNPIPELKSLVKWSERAAIIPFRTEFVVYCETLRLVGSIDLITKNYDGTYDIWDFKRTNEVKTAAYNKRCKPPLEELPHSDMTKYRLQLSIYKHILETKYDMQIRKIWNLAIKDNSYKVYEYNPIPIEMFDEVFVELSNL